MARAVPSEVVSVIDAVYPWAATQANNEGSHQGIGHDQSERVSAILELVEAIPQELLVLSGDDYNRLLVGKGACKDALERWRHGGGGHYLEFIRGFTHLNPIALIRQMLGKCPDQVPPAAAAELTFITDADFRDSLRLDIGTAYQAFAGREWKPATVIAGSVVEALLLWALSQRVSTDPMAISNAVAHLQAHGLPAGWWHGSLEDWGLAEYAEVAAHLAIIKPDSKKVVDVARNFRNLIHPGKAKRLGQQCDRGTAHVALAAVDLVIRDLM